MHRSVVKPFTMLAGAAFFLTVPLRMVKADSIGPDYFLYSQKAGYGPCASSSNLFLQGTVGISPHVYKTVSAGSRQEGNIQYNYFWENGFNSAVKYFACVNSYPQYRYYGMNKIRRRKTTTAICYALGCYPAPSASYGTWATHRWR